jgi:hypothetical protein
MRVLNYSVYCGLALAPRIRMPPIRCMSKRWLRRTRVRAPAHEQRQQSVLIKVYLQENGLTISRGTIVDATIINAPSSTKNKDGQREPVMRQTKKPRPVRAGPADSTARIVS